MEEEKKSIKELKKEEKIKKKSDKKKKKKTNNNDVELLDNDTKKTVKKVRIKKKVFIIPLVILIIILGVGSYFLIDYLKKDTIKNIKRKYNKYIITTKDTKLFDENRKVIGSITKNFYLELNEVKINSLNNRYLKIKDCDCYIYYKDFKKTKEVKQEENENNYLPINKNISLTKDEDFYDNNKKVLSLSKLNAPIQYMDKDNYYVNVFNKVLSVKKNKSIRVKEHTNTKEKVAEYIPIIYYARIDDNCGDDNCLKTVSVNAHIKKLKENNFYFISKDEYLNFLDGNVNLKENAVLMVTGEENTYVDSINKENKIITFDQDDGVKLAFTNKKSTKDDKRDSINSYQAKRYTVIDDYVRMAKGEDVLDINNTLGSVAVLNYHFFYDESKGERAWCNESICLEKNVFREQLQWLKDNGYKTLTIHEFADWMDGTIELPAKSVLLTVDDGGAGTGTHNGNILIPLLEEYQLNATLFLVTGWSDIGWVVENYQSKYLDIQSHSHGLHFEASCSDGRGLVACSDYATVKADLAESINVVKDNTTFCFPFYSSDNESIQAIKDLGFKYAFVGGSYNATRSSNHYLVPRYPIIEGITLNQFINMVQ